MAKPLVSILIPCYNAEKWLAETLESALSQTWSNTEIILVDDGSTDGSLAIAKQFEASNVKIISQLKKGASAARNRAFQESQGDFLQYLDADDLLSPQKIEEQVVLLHHNPPGLLSVCATVHFLDGQKPQEGIYEAGFPFLIDSDDPLNWLLKLLGMDGNAGMVHPGAWLTPRSVADASGLWDEQISLDDDGEYFARIVLNSAGIRRAETAISYYRKHRASNNLSGANSKHHRLSAIRSVNSKAQQLLSKEDSLAVRRVIARSYMEQAILAYPDYPDITAIALNKVNEMGGTDYLPVFGSSWRGELLRRLFGWKTARLVSVSYHRWKRYCFKQLG